MKFKRLLALLLALLMTGMTSCADNADETQNDDSSAVESVSADGEETEDTYVYDSLGEKNLNGYEFRIINKDEDAHFIAAEEVTGEAVNDELFLTNEYVEKRFNVTINIVDVGDPAETARTTAVANDNAFDIMIGHDASTFALSLQGMLYDLYEVPQFDFDKPWWTPNALENLTIQGRLFAASNYMSYAGINMTRVVYINKKLAEEYNIEIPYDVVREGNWTYDKMMSYFTDVTRDLDGNGVMDDKDRYAFTAGYECWYCMQEAVGVNVYNHDADGNITLELDTEHIVKYVEKLKELLNEDWYWDEYAMGEGMFDKGQALFGYSDIGYSHEIYSKGETVYGFLPTPKLDELQSDYINCGTDKPWAISCATDDSRIEIIGTICEAMSCRNFNNVIPVYFEGALQARAADSPDDSEMLGIIRDTRTIGFAYAYQLELSNIYQAYGTSSKLASGLAKLQGMAEKKLEDVLEQVDMIP